MLKKVSSLGLTLLLVFSPVAVFASETANDLNETTEVEAVSNSNELEESSAKNNDFNQEESDEQSAGEEEKSTGTSNEEEKALTEEEMSKEEATEKEKSNEGATVEESSSEKEVAEKEESVETKEVKTDESVEDEDLDLERIHGTANGDIAYNFQKGYYVLDLQAGFHNFSKDQTINNKWVAFALPNGVYMVDDEIPSGVVQVRINGKNGIAVKIPDVGIFPDSKYVYPKIPLMGEPNDNDPVYNLYMLNVDVNENTFENLGQVKSQRQIDFSVMEGTPQLELNGSIVGKAAYNSNKGYYMLDVTVKAQNESDSNVNDLYAGFKMPEGVKVLENEDTPANVEMIELDDGSTEIAVKLPKLNTNSARTLTYKIPVIGKSSEKVEATKINAYRFFSDDTYQPVGEYKGHVSVDYSEMNIDWDFSAESQIVKDFPGLDKGQFGLRFAFKVNNNTLDDVEKVKVEFKVPSDIKILKPDAYGTGDIPNSLKDFLDEGMGDEDIDIEWNGNTATINLETVKGISGYQGFFTGFGESKKKLEDLEGLKVVVTLYQKDDEIVEVLNVPFKIVPYKGEKPDPGKEKPNPGKKDPKPGNKKGDDKKTGGDNTGDGNNKGGSAKTGKGTQSGGSKSGTNDKTGSNQNKVNVTDTKSQNDNTVTIAKNNDDSDGTGTYLPKTATSFYTMLLIGSILLFTGGALLFFRRKSSQMN